MSTANFMRELARTATRPVDDYAYLLSVILSEATLGRMGLDFNSKYYNFTNLQEVIDKLGHSGFSLTNIQSNGTNVVSFTIRW